MNKLKLFILDSNEKEIIIKNNKTLLSKKISLINPTDIEFEDTFSWVLESVSEFNDFENFITNEVEISDFNEKDNSSPPMHREFLLAFKNMFENELNSIFKKLESLKEK